jgi:hypothetical protein
MMTQSIFAASGFDADSKPTRKLAFLDACTNALLEPRLLIETTKKLGAYQSRASISDASRSLGLCQDALPEINQVREPYIF